MPTENDPEDRPRRRPYARIELERRFLLERLPAEVEPGAFERLVDTYVAGTHLRLRRVEAPDGALVLLKLGQKIPDPAAPGDPRRRQMTTLYLAGREQAALAALDGARSVKRRYRLRDAGHTFVIDVWEEPLAAAGIVLAEVECDSLEVLEALPVPSWAVREVTDEPDWSGARLAART